MTLTPIPAGCAYIRLSYGHVGTWAISSAFGISTVEARRDEKVQPVNPAPGT